MSRNYDLWWDRIMHIPYCVDKNSFMQAAATEPTPRNIFQPVPINVNLDKYLPEIKPEKEFLGNSNITRRRNGYCKLSNYSIYG